MNPDQTAPILLKFLHDYDIWALRLLHKFKHTLNAFTKETNTMNLDQTAPNGAV